MKYKSIFLILLTAPAVILGFFFNFFYNKGTTVATQGSSSDIFETAYADVQAVTGGGEGAGGCCEGAEGSCGF
jgi:hypothetical protein